MLLHINPTRQRGKRTVFLARASGWYMTFFAAGVICEPTRRLARHPAQAKDVEERERNHGDSRSMSQPPSLRVYRSRSCSRLGRPCQNSMTVGTTRYPPQCSGRGIWPSAYWRLEGANAGFQDLAIGNHLALARCPGAQPRAGRAALEVGVGFLGRAPYDRPFDPNLPLQIVPVESQRRVGVGIELAALAALVVREEDEALLVIPAQQDDPRRGTGVGRRGRQNHGVGLGNLAECRFLEPSVELADRVGIKLPLAQAQAVVVFPRLVNAQDRRS